MGVVKRMDSETKVKSCTGSQRLCFSRAISYRRNSDRIDRDKVWTPYVVLSSLIALRTAYHPWPSHEHTIQALSPVIVMTAFAAVHTSLRRGDMTSNMEDTVSLHLHIWQSMGSMYMQMLYGLGKSRIKRFTEKWPSLEIARSRGFGRAINDFHSKQVARSVLDMLRGSSLPWWSVILTKKLQSSPPQWRHFN